MAVEDFLRESKGTLKSGIVGMEGERKGKEKDKKTGGGCV